MIGQSLIGGTSNVRSILILSFCLLMTASIASAGNRLALVIGVDNYDNVSSLQKANNDARAVSTTLEGLGFRVTQLIDADRRAFSRAISSFASDVGPGDEAVFYFAGHGIQVDGRNYLLPADVPSVRPGEEEFVVNESIAADRVLSAIEGQGAQVTVLILDACRNNPFPPEGGRSVGSRSGLGRMDPPKGSFILFSAGTGQEALDRLSESDPNPNSVFTRALLPRLREKGLTIRDLVQEVRVEVNELAGTIKHNQFPAYYDQLAGKFSFNPGDAASSEPLEPQNTPNQQEAETKPLDPCEAARADWQVFSSTRSATALEEFARTYAICPIYVAAALDRLNTLSSSAGQSAIAPSAPTAPTSGDICSRLWYERNLIFHNNGYCFQTARAKAVFNISQCTGGSPSLSPTEQREVARIQATERANGC